VASSSCHYEADGVGRNTVGGSNKIAARLSGARMIVEERPAMTPVEGRVVQNERTRKTHSHYAGHEAPRSARS